MNSLPSLLSGHSVRSTSTVASASNRKWPRPLEMLTTAACRSPSTYL